MLHVITSRFVKLELNQWDLVKRTKVSQSTRALISKSCADKQLVSVKIDSFKQVLTWFLPNSPSFMAGASSSALHKLPRVFARILQVSSFKAGV